MGFPRNSCTDSIDLVHTPCSSKPPPVPRSTEDTEFEVNFKSSLYQMIWNYGTGCGVIPLRRRRREHNKAWLLAESGGCSAADESYSGHSSFRFSLCSQIELDSMAVKNSSSSTVLMVNLNDGMLADSISADHKWRRVNSLERILSPVTHSLVKFTYSEILSATRNFAKRRILGRGALSCVFRGRVGFLRTSVAIKCLDKEDKECTKAFCRELMIASSLHNPHIVPLVGFCIDAREGLFLVYKYVSGGSLDTLLHDKKRGVKGGPTLPWSIRYSIALGIAEAIEYLQNGTERCLVHRDIKPSNILLSSKKTPKLCDFGLATWTPAPSVPFLCKTVKGTFGYLAPEYFQHGKVSNKTDIYAFGVVLLELITGRKPIELKRGPGEENLVLWAKPLLQQGNVDQILDPWLRLTKKNSSQITQMVQAATVCIHDEESRRPDMSDIITILKGKENCGLSQKTAILQVGNASDFNTQLKRSKSEMKKHFALAMLGVELEDDNYHHRC